MSKMLQVTLVRVKENQIYSTDEDLKVIIDTLGRYKVQWEMTKTSFGLQQLEY